MRSARVELTTVNGDCGVEDDRLRSEAQSCCAKYLSCPNVAIKRS